MASAIQTEGLVKSFTDQVVLDSIDLDVAQGRLRAPRAEWRREDHDGPHPLHAAAARSRSRAGGEPRCGARASHRTRPDWRDRPVLRCGWEPDWRGEPAADGRPPSPGAPRGTPARQRAARALRVDRCRTEATLDLLRRHAPPAGPRHDGGRPSTDGVPRRANHRPRPRSRAEMWQIVRELVAAGTTILLTTQNLDDADELAHRIGQGLPGGGGSAAYLEYVVPGIVFLAVVGGGSSLRSQSPRT